MNRVHGQTVSPFEVAKKPAEQPRSRVRHVAGVLAHRVLRVAETHATLHDNDNPLQEINQFHRTKTLLGMEGYMQKQQAKYFRDLLIHKPGIKRIAEIGFNGGHSSFVFLDTSQDTTVTSFDLGEHDYVDASKEFIDSTFGKDRHELWKGQSIHTVTGYASRNPGASFDLIFIDGGHDEATAAADLENMRQLAHPGTIVVMDDYNDKVNYGIGPFNAWNAALNDKKITQDSIQSGDGRRWVTGRYWH